MFLEDLLIASRVKRARKKEKVELMHQMLRTSSHPEKIVEHMNTFELRELDAEILKKPMEGYKNFYDYLLKNVKDYKYRPKKEDMGDIDLIQTWYLNKGILDGEMMTSDVLLSTLPSGETILDAEINANNFIIDTPIVDTQELAQALISRKKYDLLKNSTIDVLKLKTSTGKTLLEIMLENKVLPNVKYVEPKNSLFSFDNTPGQDILLEPVKGNKKVIDFIAESGLDFNFSVLALDKEKDHDLAVAIARAAVVYDRYDTINNGLEWFYLTEIPAKDTSYTLLSFMGGNNSLPKIFGDITEPAIIKKFLFDPTKKMDLLRCCTAEGLTTEISEGITPLSFLLYKETERMKELGNFEYRMDPENLQTMMSSLVRDKKFNRAVSLEFAKYGFYMSPVGEEIEVGLNKGHAIEQYIYQNDRLPIEDEYQDLISRFREAFSSEENSKQVIETIITSFSHTVFDDKESSIRDLEALIEYKEEYPNFKIMYDTSKGSAFLGGKRMLDGKCYLTLDNPDDIYALAHEWGHLVHEVYAGGETPEEFKALIPHDSSYWIKNYEESLELLRQIDREAKDLYEDTSIDFEFMDFIKKAKGSKENYIAEIRQDYMELIGSDTLLVEAMKEQSYSNEVLDALCNACYGEEKEKYMSEEYITKYVEERIKAEKKAFKQEKFRKDQSEFLCYENFVDAYYGGALGTVRTKAKSDAPTCTHDTNYFMSNDERQFKEMFANYVELTKAPNGHKYIERLKEKTSPELMTAMDAYYKTLGKENKKMAAA